MVILAQFQQPESPVVHEQRNTRAIFNKKDLGLGTAYISERTLCWKDQDGGGFSIEYPHISMHGKTSDPLYYESECIYIMIDQYFNLPGENPDPPLGGDNSDEESEPDISELILVPSDSTALDPVYNAISHCQTLNPDVNDSMSDLSEDEEDNMYQDAENYVRDASMNDVGAGGDTEVNRLSAQLQNQSVNEYPYGNGDQNFYDDQFQDAD